MHRLDPALACAKDFWLFALRAVTVAGRAGMPTSTNCQQQQQQLQFKNAEELRKFIISNPYEILDI